MASPKELVSLGVKERFRKLGWLNVTLIAGFLALVLVLVEFVRYENSQHCALDEMNNMMDAMKSQYSKEHANKEPELMESERWLHAHWPEAESTCSHKYRFDPLFSSFDSINTLRVYVLGVLTYCIGVITLFKGWIMSTYIGTHPEVVTNMLDLISLIFATPQLLLLADVTNTIISAFGGMVIFISLYSGITFIVITIVYHFNLENSDWIAMLSLIISTLFGFGGGIYVMNNQERIERGIKSALSKHLFAIGIGLFFMSRLLAIGFAIYK
jgi:hypothetical protein